MEVQSGASTDQAMVIHSSKAPNNSQFPRHKHNSENPTPDLQLGTKQHRWVEGARRGRKAATGPNQPGWRRNFCLVGNQGLDSISHTSAFPELCGGAGRLLGGWWHLSSGRSTSDCSL